MSWMLNLFWNQKEIIAIFTNNESDNNNKNIEVDKLEVEHAKEQE